MKVAGTGGPPWVDPRVGEFSLVKRSGMLLTYERMIERISGQATCFSCAAWLRQKGSKGGRTCVCRRDAQEAKERKGQRMLDGVLVHCCCKLAWGWG